MLKAIHHRESNKSDPTEAVLRRVGIVKVKSLYPSQNAVNRLLVYVDRDGVFSQARSDGAEVVQRRHPERHFCLFAAELVHLKRAEVIEGA